MNKKLLILIMVFTFILTMVSCKEEYDPHIKKKLENIEPSLGATEAKSFELNQAGHSNDENSPATVGVSTNPEWASSTWDADYDPSREYKVEFKAPISLIPGDPEWGNRLREFAKTQWDNLSETLVTDESGLDEDNRVHVEKHYDDGVLVLYFETELILTREIIHVDYPIGRGMYMSKPMSFSNQRHDTDAYAKLEKDLFNLVHFEAGMRCFSKCDFEAYAVARPEDRIKVKELHYTQYYEGIPINATERFSSGDMGLRAYAPCPLEFLLTDDGSLLEFRANYVRGYDFDRVTEVRHSRIVDPQTVVRKIENEAPLVVNRFKREGIQPLVEIYGQPVLTYANIIPTDKKWFSDGEMASFHLVWFVYYQMYAPGDETGEYGKGPITLAVVLADTGDVLTFH